MKPSTKNSFPVMENNLGKVERGISLAAGFYFLYRALKKKSYLRAAIGGYLMFRGGTGYCAVSQLFGQTSVIKNHNINCRVSVYVKRPRHEVYEFWRKLDHFSLFMQHLEEVQTLDEKTSVWKAAGPGKLPGLVWISEIVEDQKDDRIGWRTLEGSDITNAGNVHFRDAGDNATEVHVVISYKPMGGKAGEKLAKLLNPALETIVKEDLNNFKWMMETGGLPKLQHERAK